MSIDTITTTNRSHDINSGFASLSGSTTLQNHSAAAASDALMRASTSTYTCASGSAPLWTPPCELGLTPSAEDLEFEDDADATALDLSWDASPAPIAWSASAPDRQTSIGTTHGGRLKLPSTGRPSWVGFQLVASDFYL